MSIQEAKHEIVILLDQLSDESIITVLDYIREMVSLSQIDPEATDHLQDILKEDDELLKRLAK